MLVHLRRSLVVSVVLLVICGLAYPALMTGIGQLVFKSQANGSLVQSGSTILGSSLAGQSWSGPKWFQGRPDGDNPMATGSQNYGPKSELLYQFSRKEMLALEHEGIAPTSDLVTGSGSGVDPDISPAGAYAQVEAVASANHLRVATVRQLVARHVVGEYWGFLGAPFVDVLQLNIALAQLGS